MGWKEIMQIAILVIRGIAWLVANVKLFVRSDKLAYRDDEGQLNGWLPNKSEDDEFVIWRVSAGLPDLALLGGLHYETVNYRNAFLEDVREGRLRNIPAVLCFGERDECIEWTLQYQNTDERFIAICTSNTDVIEEIARKLEREGD